jgi:hypothetical protein
MMYFFEFKMPLKIFCVDGGASKLGKTITRLGGTRVFLVTDAGVFQAGLTSPACSAGWGPIRASRPSRAAHRWFSKPVPTVSSPSAEAAR